MATIYNGHFATPTAWVDDKAFEFDGTPEGLNRSALAKGAAPGDIVQANFLGSSKAGAKSYRVAVRGLQATQV